MTTHRNFEVSGLITAIEPLNEGYSRITIQSIDEAYKEVKIVFFDNVDKRYDAKAITYQESEIPKGNLLQKITGEGIDLFTQTERKKVNEFRKRSEFIPQKEIEL